MSDQELAAAVQQKVAELNEAIKAAEEGGLRAKCESAITAHVSTTGPDMVSGVMKKSVRGHTTISVELSRAVKL